ncbi:arylsulfatase [Novosphingobium pentaromativorans]|uniref:Sulfatase n=2 Tax=Novosphingobium pentaromativorans TaxID=205844 RepID=G6EGG2_9SPHN|nr:arylsulfatase [Novosphingobium pentaromativorans]AIT82116.1 arylsulfatase [Novosphingobium pentaromativorans US6-1]EHJ59613.1 sulfatase [Novosphingobium pentaromativorans US6-1]
MSVYLKFGTVMGAALLIMASPARSDTPQLPEMRPIPEDYPAIPVAPDGAPNILLVLTDDVGFGAASAFGGPVATPNLERLAEHGLRYNRFHTTAMCSPTRASLLTGRNHHAVATGALTDFAVGAPGYTGIMPKSAATIAEVLRRGGYNTAWFGKHHNMPKGPFGSAGPQDWWPSGLGFEYFFGFIGADTDQWRPTLYRGTSRVVDTAQESILDERLGNEAIAWIHQQKAAAPDKPFFVYYAPGSAHTPHQAPPEWIARFRGKFSQGWEKVREETLARQKAMGLVPQDAVLPPWPEDVPHWDSLSAGDKALQERMMEAFAGELAFQDAQFGRIMDELARMGQRNNTLVVFIEGDNGADSAASPAGALAESGEIGNKRMSAEERSSLMDRIGGPYVHSNYGTGWAIAMDTPFPYYKQIASHLGGTRNGMIISWPGRIEQAGVRSQYAHVIDVYPTLLGAAGIAQPRTIDGVAQQKVDGIDLGYSFEHPGAPSRRHVQYYEMLGNRAIYKDGWLANTTPQREPWHMFSVGPRSSENLAPDYKWELYNLDEDFNQTHDLAQKEPARLAAMQQLFDEQVQIYNVDPVDDRLDAARAASASAHYVKVRGHYDFWGKGISLQSDVAPPITNRSFRVSADVTAGSGVLLALGSSLGGWSFAITGGQAVVHHALSPLPADQFELAAPLALTPGQSVQLEFEFDYDGQGLGKGGGMVIRSDGRQIAQGYIARTITVPEGYNENFDIGFDGGVPVIEALGQNNAFTGTIFKVRVDLGPVGQASKPPVSD